MSPRGLPFLLILVSILTISLGNFAAWSVKRIDGEYSAAIFNATRRLSLLGRIAENTREVDRALTEGLLNPNLANIHKTLAESKNSNERLFKELDDIIDEPKAQAALDDLKARRLAYRNSCETFLVHLEAGKRAEAISFRQQNLLKSLDNYQLSIKQLCEQIKASLLRANDDLSGKTSRASRIFVGIGFFPLALASMLIAIVLLLLFALAWRFRGEESF